jgi:hypothetical protein
MTEVMCAEGHPGAGKADAFFSHAQAEPLRVTLEAMQAYEAHRMCGSLKLFLDFPSLRQCKKDFDLAAVERGIKEIGRTVVMLDPLLSPVVTSRLFCIFEIGCSVRNDVPLDITLPTPVFEKFVGMLLSDLEGVKKLLGKVDVQDAAIREGQETVKQEILGTIERQCGIAEMNKLVSDAIVSGVVMKLYGEAHICSSLDFESRFPKEFYNMRI